MSLDLENVSKNFFAEKNIEPEIMKIEEKTELHNENSNDKIMEFKKKKKKKKKRTLPTTFHDLEQNSKQHNNHEELLKNENIQIIKETLESYEGSNAMHFPFEFFIEEYSKNNKVKMLVIEPSISEIAVGIKPDLILVKPLNRQEYLYFMETHGKVEDDDPEFEKYLLKKCILSYQFTDNELDNMSYARYATLLYYIKSINELNKKSRLLEV